MRNVRKILDATKCALMAAGDTAQIIASFSTLDNC